MNHKNINYSSGKIITLWRLLLLIADYYNNGIKVKDLVNILGGSGYFGGTVPVKESIVIGHKHNFIKIKNEIIFLSDYTKNVLLPLCENENPNVEILQKIIYPIVSENRFHWLIFFNEDVSIFQTAIPPSWLDILNEANLFDFSNYAVERWWKDLLENFNTISDANLKEIGNLGELFTKEFEEERIKKEGIKNYRFHVKWVSRISEAEGYDFISIRGKLLQSRNNQLDTIKIEVKSSVITNIKNFRFKVSRNEWNTALSNIDSYYFYCWTGIDINSKAFTAGPFIIPAKKIINYFPSDNHDMCEWTECRLLIDLNNYNIL